MGAWIETGSGRITIGGRLVAPRMGAWIETESPSHAAVLYLRRAPHGRVD